MTIDLVTPRLESVPERTYMRDGSIIKVYEVLSVDEASSSVNKGDMEIFIITLESEEIAVALMEDLYYGQYTGG